MKYYLHNGDEKHGPFSLEELKSKFITKETSVWREGLEAWTNAGSLEELNSLFSATPPPFKKQEATTKSNSGSGRFLVAGILLILIVALMTNPNVDVHRGMASNALNKRLEDIKADVNPKKKFWKVLKEVTFALSNGLLQEEINKRVSSADYYVCSLTKIQLKNRDVTIGFGAFGTVWLFTDLVNSIRPEEIIE